MKEFFKYVFATIVGVIVVSVVGSLLFFMVIGIIVSSAEKQVKVKNNTMLVLNLDRQIVDRAPNDPFQDIEIPGMQQIKSIGLDDIQKSLEKAVKDDRIKGVYLKLSMTNGGMASVEEIRNYLMAFKDSCDKPVYAYGDNLDQKAYYLATVADQIVVNPMGIVDFRGLGGEQMFFTRALEKIGVDMQIVRHGKFKAAVEPFMLEEMSEENREQTMGYMNSLWDHMVEGISEMRNIPVNRLNELADEVQTLRKAPELKETGLIDASKYKDEVLDDLREIAGIEGTKGVPIVSASDYAGIQLKDDNKPFSRNKVAVIYASGDIGVSMGGEAIIGDKLGREIRKVRQDSTYKAVVLRVNSPGGSVFDSEVIWREVKLTAEEKTMVVSFGDVAASGGYYIACPADKIVAHPNTITGSIGVFGIIPNFGELLKDKIGISTDVVKTNEHADFMSLTRPMTDYERMLMQNNIEEVYDTFISHVAEGRNMSKEAVDDIGQGRVWSGENAKEIGLVDEYGGVMEAIQLAAEMEGLENYRTVSLPHQPDPFEEIFKTGPDRIRTWIMKKELGEKYPYFEYMKKAATMNGVYARLPYDIIVQ